MSLNPKHIHIAKLGFERKCIYVFVDAYYSLIQENTFTSSWKENKITKELVRHFKKSNYFTKWGLDIIREYYLDDYYEDTDPDKTPRIDIKITNNQTKKKFDYFIEAKNLCETDWNKSDGATVKSSYQLNRYVNKGIKHFISGYYPSNGCLCGYILHGDTKNIIQKINEILNKKSLNNLILANPINNHSLIYNYSLDSGVLINLFFELIK